MRNKLQEMARNGSIDGGHSGARPRKCNFPRRHFREGFARGAGIRGRRADRRVAVLGPRDAISLTDVPLISVGRKQPRFHASVAKPRGSGQSRPTENPGARPRKTCDYRNAPGRLAFFFPFARHPHQPRKGGPSAFVDSSAAMASVGRRRDAGCVTGTCNRDRHAPYSESSLSFLLKERAIWRTNGKA